MMYIKLNNRLQTVVDMIEDGMSVVDVGTDHGYLPVYLALNKDCGKLIATDINEQPLMRAAHTIYENDLRDRIELRLCDGLSCVEPEEVDCIVIAGLGGDTIISVLDSAKWTADSSKTLLLQPMSRSENVREYLLNNGFKIEKERVARDGNHLYTIMCVKYFGSEYKTYGEWYKYVGEVTRNRDELSLKYVRRQLDRLRTAADGLMKSRDIKEIEKADHINEIIATIKKRTGDLL